MTTCKDLVFKSGSNKCVYHADKGMCAKDERFRCEEYIKQKEPVLSYSGINSFMKCPRKYYWSSIRGLKVKEELMGDPLKIGLRVDGYMTTAVAVSREIENVADAKIHAMCDAIAILLKPQDIWINYSGQINITWQEDGYPNVLCKIDLERNDGESFVELKCSSRPDFYTNPFYIHDQVGTYFLANDRYKQCEVWVIRVPALRLGKTENIQTFYERCYNDMVARPGYYFNEYDGHNKSFGSTYYRSEFDLDMIKMRISWIGKHIVEAVKADYWYQDRQQCMLPGKCDYMSVCDTGGVSNDLYEWRKNEPTDENLLIAIRIKGIVDGFIKQVEDYSPAFVLNVLTTLVAGFLISHEKFPSLNVNSFAKAVELTMKKVKEGLEENEKKS